MRLRANLRSVRELRKSVYKLLRKFQDFERGRKLEHLFNRRLTSGSVAVQLARDIAHLVELAGIVHDPRIQQALSELGAALLHADQHRRPLDASVVASVLKILPKAEELPREPIRSAAVPQAWGNTVLLAVAQWDGFGASSSPQRNNTQPRSI